MMDKVQNGEVRSNVDPSILLPSDPEEDKPSSTQDQTNSKLKQMDALGAGDESSNLLRRKDVLVPIPLSNHPSEPQIKIHLDSNNHEPDMTVVTNQDEDDPQAIARKKWYRYLGLILTVFSAMMFSMLALVFKVLKSYHPITIATWMFIVSAILAAIFYGFYFFKHKNCSSSQNGMNLSLMSKKKMLLLWVKTSAIAKYNGRLLLHGN
jgi:hypothetical protein